MTYLLAIDPGTRCGWAVFSSGEHVASGTWDLSPRRGEGAGMRMVKFRNNLNQVLAAYPPILIAYEEVMHHNGTDAAHVYGAITGQLMEIGESHKPFPIPYLGIPVGTVKKRATGKGNANKDCMIRAARGFWPRVVIVDDNHADALCIGLAAQHEFKEFLAERNPKGEAK